MQVVLLITGIKSDGDYTVISIDYSASMVTATVECKALVAKVNTVAVVGGGVELAVGNTVFNELLLDGFNTVLAETDVVWRRYRCSCRPSR